MRILCTYGGINALDQTFVLHHYMKGLLTLYIIVSSKL